MSWLENCSIDVVVGDVLAMEADVLGLGVKSGPRLYGRASRSIIERRGPGLTRAVERECQQRVADRRPFGASDSFRVDAAQCGLPEYRSVLGVCFWEDEGDYTDAGLVGAWCVALRALISVGPGAQHAVFPVIGAGGWSGRMSSYGAIVARVVAQFDGLRNSASFAMEGITIVATSSNVAEEIQSGLR